MADEKKVCLVCGMGKVESISISTQVIFRNEPVRIIVPAERCSTCGEEVIKASDLRRATLEAVLR